MLRKEENVLNELYATEIFPILPSVDFSKHVILKCYLLKL